MKLPTTQPNAVPSTSSALPSMARAARFVGGISCWILVAACSASQSGAPVSTPSVGSSVATAGPSSTAPTTTTATPDGRGGQRFACNWSGENLEPGRTFHVSGRGADTNTGMTPEQALRTLHRAAQIVRPGDTVLVHDGTYARQGEPALLVTTSGTERAPITFKAAPGEHPVVEGRAWHTLQIANASYIVLEGFDVVGRNRAIDLAFARAHQLDRDLDVTNGDGIHVWNYPSGQAHHIVIRNNRVHHFGGSGILASEADCLTIVDNVVYSNSWYTVHGTSGINIWKMRDLVDGPGYKTVIRDNKVFDNENMIPWIDAAKDPEPVVGGNGIILDASLDLNYRGPVLVEGNVAYRNGGCGLQAFKAQRTDFIGNTSFRNMRNSKIDWGELCAYESVTTRFLRNTVEASQGRAVSFVRRSPDTEFDHNVYWPAQAAIAMRGKHDQVADPGFLDVSGKDTPGSFSDTGFDFRRRTASER